MTMQLPVIPSCSGGTEVWNKPNVFRCSTTIEVERAEQGEHGGSAAAALHAEFPRKYVAQYLSTDSHSPCRPLSLQCKWGRNSAERDVPSHKPVDRSLAQVLSGTEALGSLAGASSPSYSAVTTLGLWKPLGGLL